MSDKIEWVETMPAPRNTIKRRQFFEELAKHPMKWAVMQRQFRSSTTAYALHHPGYEFSARADVDGTRTCYARYVGEKKEEGEK